ncbi:Protein quiver [Sergentomyia squamirostris]
MSLTKGFFFISLCLAMISVTSAIMCYHCNSAYDPHCGDPFVKDMVGVKNCSFENELDHLPDVPATLCRKTLQKVYGTIRIVRGCGYVTDPRDNKDCMKRSGTHDVQALYCSCTQDHCNEASPISFSSTAVAIFAIVTTLWGVAA